ncbi:hypothetical protein BABINDRAFT_159785 [Babjeviella inositovora NRRL Y-12698]|uniref:Uncharacterized protein n=1 Tax=Babjeviella inositovora NRRL Y-12698 TaxID=984486 RepID=A0A1E3QV77_9ASCO|nr:uncharacterized protein BABINDRAFT_159785 [Babjeviella inositovora NRRL Y-12698]ODQ81504.1 hypothetical protein BABINDRAFT_159785 [Babjeviella inositovora NRRL Y-12698]
MRRYGVLSGFVEAIGVAKPRARDRTDVRTRQIVQEMEERYTGSPRFSNAETMYASLSDTFIEALKAGPTPESSSKFKRYAEYYRELSAESSRSNKNSNANSLTNAGLASKIIKTQGLNRSYKRTLDERYAIPRLAATPESAVSYSKFSALLYNPEADLVKLFDAYCALPSPKPVHVQPQHFELFLDRFLAAADNYSASTLDNFLEVVQDMKGYGFPLSVHEQNKLIYLQFLKHTDRQMLTLETYRDLVATLEGQGNRDISTFDILLKSAMLVKGRKGVSNEETTEWENYDVIHAILCDIATKKVVPRRTTVQAVMALIANIDEEYIARDPRFREWKSQEVFTRLMKLHLEHFVTDEKFVTLVVHGLVGFGKAELAELLVGVFSKTFLAKLLQERGDTGRSSAQLHRMVDDILQVLPQADVPQYLVKLGDQAYRHLIEYYCKLPPVEETFTQVMALVDVMNQSQILLSSKTLNVVYQGFMHNNSSIDEKKLANNWSLANLNIFTKFVLELYANQEMSQPNYDKVRFPHYFQTSSIVFTRSFCANIFDCYLMVLGQDYNRYGNSIAKLLHLKATFNNLVTDTMESEKRLNGSLGLAYGGGYFSNVVPGVKGDIMRDLMRDLILL